MVKKPPPGDRHVKTLDRVFSKSGLGSRSEARQWIARGRVAVNGETVRDPDAWIDLDRDSITLDGRPLRSEAPVYVLLYKPTGYLTTYRHPKGRATVYDLVGDVGQYLVPVGRLDLDTSGLLLMTNDTAFVEKMTNPVHEVPKTYLVKASTTLAEEQLERLRSGFDLDDGPTRPAAVRRLRETPSGRTFFEITITEGRNRQVRRMVEALGAHVLKLVRVAIGPLTIGSLPIGKWRELTTDELAAFGVAGPNAKSKTADHATGPKKRRHARHR